VSPHRKRRPVVLYQPADEGPVMPLGLLAVGSWLSGEHVVIVDGRFELAPESRVVELARSALCLGVSARTGGGLGEALRVSAAARAASPELPIVWGGPHPTLHPGSCLESGVVDACAVGAGEEPLEAAVAALRAGHSLREVGLLTVAGEEACAPAPPPTTLWPRADYTLLDLERHFERRGERRLDYCSSRGARDGATWMGLRAERVVAETHELSERYRLAEVLFQDEDFFADPERVDAIALGMLEGGPLRWQGGARPEDVTAAGPERLRLLLESGCRRLNLPVRPGGAARDLLLEAGSRLHAAGLAARFVFDVREPQDGVDSLKPAVAVARSLCALDERFETPIRRVPDLRPEGAPTVEDWAARAEAPWKDRRAERRRARATFFFGEAQRDPGRRLGKRLVRLLALVRVRLGFFGLDVDRLAVEAAAVLRTGRARRPPQHD
jgi:anaerobic magnesium-protoporphyrin IX monomethyl ester cyclase